MMEEDDSWRQRDDQAREELEQIRLQMDRTTDKSLESTRNMLRMTEESHEAGANTLVMLNEQGEQLKRTEGRLDDAHAHLQEASKNLDQLEKCCGCCILPWRRGTKTKQGSLATTYDSVDKKAAKKAEKEAKKREKEEKKKGFTPPTSSAISEPQPQQDEQFFESITGDAREDEMNQNMNDVSRMLQGLKSMGEDMYNEIERQNDDIDRIKTKADIMDDETRHANKRAHRIVRNQ